jgi:glycolate oxidase FAD binding subunit
VAASSLHPSTFEEAASRLAQASAEGVAVRPCGGATKLGWGHAGVQMDREVIALHTTALDRIVEHNEGDLTAVLEAGVPLARAQERFAHAGQMLALDPPLGGRDAAGEEIATIGGILATGDSGPLRHRYGAPRDLVLGMTVALSDGTLARSGGKVIKNVAGYDLAKLFSGSFGTLGVILSVSVRLHPLPVSSATALGASSDPAVLASAARALAASPLELDALDVAWRTGRGGILARVAGAESTVRARRAARLMQGAGLGQVDIADDDAPLWARQRAGQRSPDNAIARISARPSALAEVIRCAEECGGTLVGRAALGTSFVELDPAAVSRLRGSLPAHATAVVLDAPPSLRGQLDPWGVEEGPALELMRRVKALFDPAGACNPGVFVGGI